MPQAKFPNPQPSDIPQLEIPTPVTPESEISPIVGKFAPQTRLFMAALLPAGIATLTAILILAGALGTQDLWRPALRTPPISVVMASPGGEAAIIGLCIGAMGIIAAGVWQWRTARQLIELEYKCRLLSAYCLAWAAAICLVLTALIRIPASAVQLAVWERSWGEQVGPAGAVPVISPGDASSASSAGATTQFTSAERTRLAAHDAFAMLFFVCSFFHFAVLLAVLRSSAQLPMARRRNRFTYWGWWLRVVGLCAILLTWGVGLIVHSVARASTAAEELNATARLQMATVMCFIALFAMAGVDQAQLAAETPSTGVKLPHNTPRIPALFQRV